MDVADDNCPDVTNGAPAAHGLHPRLVEAAAFLTPALCVWPSSGYAWGTGLLVLGGLIALPRLVHGKVPRDAWWLVAAFVLMGCIWLHGSDWSKGWGVLNKPGRYAFALLALFYALRYPPRPWAFKAGILFGALSGGAIAAWQVLVLGMDRPWTDAQSTANAIQLGDLSGLLGLLCWVMLLVYWRHWRPGLRALAAVCCIAGLLGSLLSQSRGGWLALLLCAPIVLLLMAREASARRVWRGVLLLLVLAVPVIAYMGDVVQQRVDEAMTEVFDYHAYGDDVGSVGQRLDQWKIAWNMGLQKPLAGWGEAGFMREKARQVESGAAPPEILPYGHAHDEFLDQFAKRGLIGVLGLALFYAIPLALFWPRRRQRLSGPGADCDDRLFLHLAGVAVVLGFLGFGLTQVFFAHFNGVVMYPALLTLAFAALWRVRMGAARAHAGSALTRPAPAAPCA